MLIAFAALTIFLPYLFLFFSPLAPTSQDGLSLLFNDVDNESTSYYQERYGKKNS